MAPIIKTYGGYKPKRKGLPKYVVKETLQTSGNLFSAFHIDNLKVMRGADNRKPKTQKTTTTTVRNFKPVLDDSLDSTFDKLLKTSESKTSDNQAVTKLGTKIRSNKCWTCGCIPRLNMAHHVHFECKEDSYYLDPSPKTLKRIKRLENKLTKINDKDKGRKRLKLQKSVCTSSKKNTEKKEKAVSEDLDINSSKNTNHFKTPKIKNFLLGVKSSAVATSTPELWARRPEFSVAASPIFAGSTTKRFDQISSHPMNVQLLLGVKSSTVATSTPKLCSRRPKFSLEPSPILSECTTKKFGQISSPPTNVSNIQPTLNNVNVVVLDSLKEPGAFADNFQNEIQTLEDSCSKLQLLTENDDFKKEEKSEVGSGETKNISAHLSGDLVENSVVEIPVHPPYGYITKRRMWRKTRRTVFNVSVDMFESSHKSTLDNHSADGRKTCKLDQLQTVTSRTDESFLSRKEQRIAQQHFSISCDVRGNDSVVKLIKSGSNYGKLLADGSNIQCVNDNSICDRSHRNETALEDSNVPELSRQLMTCLNLLPSEEKSVQSTCESDCDMFSGLSEQNSESHAESFKSSRLFEDQVCILPSAKETNFVISQMKSFHSTLDVGSRIVDESVRHQSFSSDIVGSADVLLDLVLKPCYVKLHKCDAQTVADVMYTSQCHSVIVDEKMDFSSEILNESNQYVSSKKENTLETVVQLPLVMLGKLDKITFHSSSKISLQCLDSIVNEGKLLDPTVQKFQDLLTEENETSVEQRVDDEEKNLDDFKEILSRCGQTELLPFATCYPETMQPNCRKIGEGAYGEVFLYNGEKQKTVIKIIPIEGDIEINAAVQKKFWEIKPEVIVAQELSCLRKKSGKNFCDVFNEVLAIRCVRGKYPQWMLDLWHAYDEEHGSENDCPDVFGDYQLFIILELAHGGQDLESYEFTSADQAVAAIAQIALALSVGESEIQFEHRDLHWGNVLIAPSRAKSAQFTLEGNKYKIATKGVKVSVIDFTMSRMTMPSNGENMFYDFGHDEELFAARGDYQCDIYRLMRERTRNNWSVYEPFTNVLWLHYLLDKMCSMVAYRNQNTKVHKQAMSKLENMRDMVLAYSSATTFSSEFFKSSMIL